VLGSSGGGRRRPVHGEWRPAATACHGGGVPAREERGGWAGRLRWEERVVLGCSIWEGEGRRGGATCTRGGGTNGGHGGWFWAQGTPRLGSLVHGVEKGEGEASLQSK